MSVSEAAAPFLAVAFVLCLLGALAGAGGFKPTHLSEDPAYRSVPCEEEEGGGGGGGLMAGLID